LHIESHLDPFTISICYQYGAVSIILYLFIAAIIIYIPYSKARKEVFVPVEHLKKYILLPIIKEKQFSN
jgi:hypothetical protein